MAHRVVITGIGLITPVGNDTASTWEALIQGRSGIKHIPELFNLTNYSVKAAGIVTGEQALLNAAVAPKNHSRMDRFIQLAMIAGKEAMHDAGFDKTLPEDRTRIGVYLGVGFGGLASISEAVCDLEQGGPRKVSPFAIPKAVSNLGPAWLSIEWNLQGPLLAIANACASGSDALGLAFRSIRDGYADCMLAGGAESCVTPIGIVSFGNMRALTTWAGDPAHASRPFDAQRSGFAIAEGAGVLALERADKAIARGAKIYAEIVGYGSTADAYHITAMHPESRGAVQAMQQALDQAEICPSDVGYINAHGTATHMNDALETQAIKKLFGAHADPAQTNHLLVSSTKSMTGHMLGAAGAVEASITALALREGLVPPTINLTSPDQSCDLDYVPLQARSAQLTYALSNSFAFGGGNAVLALKKWL